MEKNSFLKKYKSAIGIFILAFALRLAYVLLLKGYYFFYGHPASDVLYYQQWAQEISHENWLGTKTFWGLPLYPYSLAMIERLALGRHALIQIIHLAIGSFNCVLTYFIAAKLFTQRVALTAGILMATNFLLIFYDWIHMPVPLLILLSQTIIITFLHKDEIKNKREWVILGILFGLTALGDGKILIFFTFTLIYLFILNRKDNFRKMLHSGMLMILGVCLILGITGLRNKIIGGSWVWITAQSGLSFYVGNNPQANGLYENPDFIRPNHQGQDEDQIMMAEQLTGHQLTPAQVSQFWKSKGLDFIKNNPGAYLHLLIIKFRLFFTEAERAFDIDLLLQQGLKHKLDFNSYHVLCPLAILGILLNLRRRDGTMYLNLMILSQLAFTLIFFLTTHHRTTIFPFLIIFESSAIWWLIENFREKKYALVIGGVSLIITFIAILKPQRIDPKDLAFLGYAKAGPIYEERNNFPKAQEEYYRALKIYPNDTNSLYNLATSFLKMGAISNAQEYYQKVLALNPQHIDSIYNLAYSYEQIKNNTKAAQLYLQVLALVPQSIDAHLRLAQIYQKEGQCANANKHFEAIIRINPRLAQEVNTLMSQCH